MAKKKIIKNRIENRDSLEAAIAADLGHKLARDMYVAEVNEKILAVKQNYDTIFAKIDEHIEELDARIKDWFDRNKPEGEKKSIELTNGIIGYSTNPPSLKLLKGWTWEKVLEALQADHCETYIRRAAEVNKELLLENRKMIDEETFTEIGLKVSQKDKFYVKQHITNPEKIGGEA